MVSMRARLDEARRLLQEAEDRQEEEREQLVRRAHELLEQIAGELREAISEREGDGPTRGLRS